MSQICSLPYYWTTTDWREANAISSMSGLAGIALSVLRRMPQPLVQVCGPLSTGGQGTLEGNTIRFQQAIAALQKRGHFVFNQLPFQPMMIRLAEAERASGYCWPILEEFYAPIFRSRLITRVFFLSGWQSSTGATWEREMVAKCVIPIEDFPDEWFGN